MDFDSSHFVKATLQSPLNLILVEESDGHAVSVMLNFVQIHPVFGKTDKRICL